MQDFLFYFKQGWQHILSFNAIDHLLFILVLSAIYLMKDWKQVLVLITAFTIGHSATLVLSVYNVLKVNVSWVEFLIPCTIIITALFNLLQKNYQANRLKLNYLFALFFGLVHGLGYANTIKFMLAKSQTIAFPLFSFNVGLEVGQLIVVTIILLVSFFLVNKIGLQQKWWVRVLSTVSFLVALTIAIQRMPTTSI